MKFNDVLNDITTSFNFKDLGYDFPYFPLYTQAVGSILPGTFTALGGLPSAGCTSFTDQNYAMNPLFHHSTSSNKDNEILKVYYFSLKTTQKRKMQDFLCNYMMVKHQRRLDVNILRSARNRRYDLEENQEILDLIEDARDFFDPLTTSGALNIISGPQTATSIFNTIEKELGKLGTSDGNDFIYDEPNTDIIVIVDSVELLRAEDDLYGKARKKDSFNLLFNYINELKEKYQVHFVTNFLIPNYLVRRYDTMPHYSQLEDFAYHADIATILYAPGIEGTFEEYRPGEDIRKYVINGNDYLRYWQVVKNVNGPESALAPYFLLGGSSFQVEMPKPEKQLSNTTELKNILFDKYDVY